MITTSIKRNWRIEMEQKKRVGRPKKTETLKETKAPVIGTNVEVKGMDVKKEPVAEGLIKIGMSQGLTKNMGNYESYRCDLWMEKVVPENKVDEAVVEMHDSITECLTAMCESQGIEL